MHKQAMDPSVRKKELQFHRLQETEIAPKPLNLSN